MRTTAKYVVLALLLTVALPVRALTLTGSDGVAVHIAGTERIVAVGGSVTEILYVLGLEARIVAVDSTSRYPEAATAKPDVGYMRRLSAEPILALEPSLVLAVADAGPPAVLQQLREAGVPVLLVPDDPSPAGVLVKLRLISAATGLAVKGEAMALRLRAEMDALARTVAGIAARPRVLFLLSVGNGGAPLAAGTGTSAAEIVALAGGRNSIDGFAQYKPLSPEAVIAAAPDFILVTQRSHELLGGADGVLAVPGIAATPAGRAGRVVAMDGLLLLGFGPRTPLAVATLARALHPEAPGLAAR